MPGETGRNGSLNGDRREAGVYGDAPISRCRPWSALSLAATKSPRS